MLDTKLAGWLAHRLAGRPAGRPNGLAGQVSGFRSARLEASMKRSRSPGRAQHFGHGQMRLLDGERQATAVSGARGGYIWCPLSVSPSPPPAPSPSPLALVWQRPRTPPQQWRNARVAPKEGEKIYDYCAPLTHAHRRTGAGRPKEQRGRSRGRAGGGWRILLLPLP